MKKIVSLILAGLFAVSLIMPAGVLFASEEEDTREMQLQEEEENPGYEKEYDEMLKDEEMEEEKGSGEEEQDPSDEKEQADER